MNSTDFPIIYNNLFRTTVNIVKERKFNFTSNITGANSNNSQYITSIAVNADRTIKIHTNIVAGLQTSVNASFIASNTQMYPMRFFGF